MVPAKALMREVARMSGVPYDVLTSRTKARSVVRLRQAVMFVLRRKARLPLLKVYTQLGFDRTTVEHGIEAIEGRLRIREAYTQRCYRIAIRCYVRLKQAELAERATARQLIEGDGNALEHLNRVHRPELYPGYDNLDWATERLRAAA